MIDDFTPELDKRQTLFLKDYNTIADSEETVYVIVSSRGQHIIENDIAINEHRESEDTKSFNAKLDKLKTEIGDKIIPPPGFLE